MISHTSSDTPWIVGGDFNIICSLDEHRGPILPSFKGMEDFSSCIALCDLNNISPKGGIFTWHGKRSQGKVWRRLDRALVNTYAMNFFDDITLNHLSRSGSDHKPILLKGAINSYKGPKMFRFLNCWVSNDTFIPMVKLNWEKSSNVNGMSGFAEKLKILKTSIKEWNVSTFGDIFENVKMAEEEALARQNSFDNNPTKDNRAAANLASAKLLNAYLLKACQEFFLGVKVPVAFASTIITLIPKVNSPIKWKDFRPISLSTFMSKINSRILATRLSIVINKVIGPEQAGFQQGKSVDDQILLAQEMAHHLERKVEGGNIIVKIDMANAFDRMSWTFLEAVLEKMGFDEDVSNLLLSNLKATKIWAKVERRDNVKTIPFPMVDLLLEEQLERDSTSLLARIPLMGNMEILLCTHRQVRSTLIGLGLLGYVDGTLPSPPQVVDGAANPCNIIWFCQDQAIVGALLGSCTDIIQPLISNVSTARDAWLNLHSSFTSASRDHVLALKSKLGKNPRGNRSINDYLHEMHSIANELALNQSPIAEEDLVVHVLNQLGTEYDPIASAAYIRGSTLPFIELGDILQDFERKLKLMDEATSSIVATAHAAQCHHSHGSRTYGGPVARSSSHSSRPSANQRPQHGASKSFHRHDGMYPRVSFAQFLVMTSKCVAN
ncbi:unnamed protein product [Cuscuta campestris]|uniref:Reverse transcriptase domain-containing protein n=1 Tax=Cuscuta campestris TaxID=132261 RepID=A0A484MGU1_9ASTE|nr:unnamed protein product [Cuscuta campestris]